MKNPKLNYQRGLTLVEALVAITVLVVGVLGPLEIAARGIGDGLFAANQIAANYLAQEGLELVVNRRAALARQAESNSQTLNFTSLSEPELSGCITASGDITQPDNGQYCSVDAAGSHINSTSNSTLCTTANSDPCRLVFNTTSGLYEKPVPGVTTYSGPTFTRLLKVQAVSVSELKVTVTVSWFNKEVPKSLTIVEHLFSQG